MLHVCMQGNSTASANAVSMALSQGAPATAISQAVAQVVRLSPPAADLPVAADGFLEFEISVVIFNADISLLSCRLAAVLLHFRYCSCGTAPWNAWKGCLRSQYGVLLGLLCNIGLLGDVPALLLHTD